MTRNLMADEWSPSLRKKLEWRGIKRSKIKYQILIFHLLPDSSGIIVVAYSIYCMKSTARKLEGVKEKLIR